MNRRSSVVALILTILVFANALIAAPAAYALTTKMDICPELLAAEDSHDQRRSQHNSYQPNPLDHAAVDAYNAEAEAQNAERAVLQQRDRGCVEAVRLINEANPGGPAFAAPSPAKLRDVETQRQGVAQSGWSPGPLPGVKDMDRARHLVPKELSGLHREIRKDNPPSAKEIGDMPLNGTPRPGGTDTNRAYPDQTYGFHADGKTPKVSADHIVPLAALIQMPGFKDLNARNMMIVATTPANLQWMGSGPNSGKSSGSPLRLLPKADSAWVGEQITLQTQKMTDMQNLINALLVSQGT
ncbi:hypothetical protein ACPCIR_17295 [Mycobacterium sp. NPDC051198]